MKQRKTRVSSLFRRTAGIGLAALLLAGAGVQASAAVYTAEGRALIESSDVAGTGAYDEFGGAATEAAFRHPAALLALPDGSIVVADTGNHRIRLIRDGQVTVLAGTEVSVFLDSAGIPMGAYRDGPADFSFFASPMGLAADRDGNIYVADRDNHAIRRIAPDGTVTTVAGTGLLGHADGTAREAQFYAPSDVAVAPDGTLYVADTLNHAIRRIAPDGTVTTLNALSERTVEIFPGVVVGAGDFRDGAIETALFNEPTGLAIDAKGNLYVSDTGNQRIRYIDFAAGTVTTVAGGGTYEANALYVEGFYVDGPALEARLYSPRGLALDADGGLYIADSLNHSIRYLKDGRVMTVAGHPNGENGAANGLDEAAMFDFPADVAVAGDGSLLIADMYNNKIRKVTFYELPHGWTAAGYVQVLYRQTPIAFDPAPVLVSGRTMVPVEPVAAALGYTASIEQDRIVLDGEGRSIAFTVGRHDMTVTIDGNTAVRTMDQAPFVDGNRAFIPIRYLAEAIGLHVDWHGETSTVILR
jgi:sugar lactone lactonase YvrE